MMLADTQQQRHPRSVEEEESYSSEPTPVPNSFRPPPPTNQPSALAMMMGSPPSGSESHGQYQTTLLNSTVLSLSIDDVGTLPSLGLEPPSPFSQPPESIMGTPTNAQNEASQTAALSLSQARRKQQREQNNYFPSAPTSESHGVRKNRNSQKTPPIREVYMEDDQTDPTDPDKHFNHDFASTEGGESDTLFENLEDQSLADRARRSLRSDARSPSRRSMGSSRGVRSQPGKEQHGRGSSRTWGGLENIHENIGSDDVVRVHESALNALQQLKEELVKSNQRNEELVREQEKWKQEEQDLRQQLTTLEATELQKSTDLDRLRQDHRRLKNNNEATEKQRDELVKQKRDLEKQARESARTIKELRHRTLAGDNRHKEFKGQLDKLNDELEDTLSAKGEIAAELARAQSERMELEKKLETVQKELSEATNERDRAASDGKNIEAELLNERRKLQELRTSSDSDIRRLNESLRRANEAMHRLRAELTPKVRSAVRNMSSPSSQMRGTRTAIFGSTTASVESTLGPPQTLDTAIADRLARLRDSAERAHLIRGHKRELARLKADRDAGIQKLETDHADALKKVTKQLDGKRRADLEELADKLNRQFESRLEEVEEEHRKRISQLQKDYGRLQEESDESLEEALTRIARVSHNHEREKGRRHALERTVEDLNRKMKMHQKDLSAKHKGELEKQRHQWESEKEVLLSNLQRDCNVAFENRRRIVNGNPKWAGAPLGVPTTGVERNHLHVHTTQTPHSMPSQGEVHRLHQQQENNGPSPLSMNSDLFFTETKNNPANLVVNTEAAVNQNASNIKQSNVFVPTVIHHEDSPSPIAMVSRTGSNDGSPTVVSRSYSDIDSVLRETEELVKSIL
ncbi:unnamed protein product [Pseudo-nitzschia multistriata]|uniref:Uncharacterized protein n=1 Tax=Pseudo-nitzschia multistriata TaxID=183589 RepID=A0A448Z0J7_9STRA|nr:unnamed protein product [Pseudo-nitzschia multistriata]